MYTVRVYDNFHYMDEAEAYDLGNYASYEEALVQAKRIVEDFIVRHYQAGMEPVEVTSLYALYGADPAILSSEEDSPPLFSARDYAHEFAAVYCSSLRPTNPPNS